MPDKTVGILWWTMATYCRGHPKSTWWDKPPQPPQVSQVLSGPVAFAILDEALREGNRDVVNLMKMPTETEMLKQFVSSDSSKQGTGPQLTDEGISVPGVPGGMVVNVENEDPLQAMRGWVRRQVSKNTGMRPQDIHFRGEKVQAPKKKAPLKRKPIMAPPPEEPKAISAPPIVEKPKPAPVEQKASSSIALMFPGQGSQYVKMLSELKDNPVVVGYIERAKEILGYDLLDMCLFGPEKELELTKHCQPAMFLAGMAGVEKLRGIKAEAVENPGCVAGLSLGEYTALCVAGVFTFEQGMALVDVRGKAMQKAAEASPQLMLSVAGLERPKLDQICKDHSVGGDHAVVANVLFPKGFACSGTKGAIEKMQEACVTAGAMQAKVLKTSGAFHSKFMDKAQEELEDALNKLLPEMKPPRCDVYMNFTGKRLKAGTPPSEIVPLLSKQLTNTVLWEPSVKLMIEDGMNEFYEIGPMKQLKAMMKRIDAKMWEKTTNVDV